MIGTKELRQLAQAVSGWGNCNQTWLDQSEDIPAVVVGHISEDGETYPVATIDCDQYYAADQSLPLGKFYAAANPAAITEILDRLEAAEKERDSYKFAFIEYSEKTEWVQRGVNDGTVSAKYLGWHRADVMSDLLSAAEKERDALRAELTDLRNSMTFRTSLIGRIEADREDLHALIAAVKKQVNAEFRLRVKKEIECNALRAKIERMEKQEPVAEIGQQYTLLFVGSGSMTELVKRHGIKIGARLYALPGAKALLRVPDTVMAALDSLDDYIARIEGNDRGACSHVNLLRRYLLDVTDVGENK